MSEFRKKARGLLDKDLSKLKCAVLGGGTGNPNKNISIVLHVLCKMLVPFVTFPGFRMVDPDTKKELTEMEAAKLVVRGFEDTFLQYVQKTVDAQTAGGLPATIEELKEFEMNEFDEQKGAGETVH